MEKNYSKEEKISPPPINQMRFCYKKKAPWKYFAGLSWDQESITGLDAL